MSFHILHILTHGSKITVDRGCLICNFPDKSERKVPLADILIIIIAAKGIGFSNEALSSLAKRNAIILHCDENYKPIAITAKLSHIVHKQLFEKQIEKDEKFNRSLWKHILIKKIGNQVALLDEIAPYHSLKNEIIKIECEGIIQKIYWKFYFGTFQQNTPKNREHQQAQHPINQKLNYGYAVLGAIVHRSIVAHGLNPLIGIHHRYYFKSYPLVYDLIEPLRPFCDAALYKFYSENNEKDIKTWAKFIAGKLVNSKIDNRSRKTKLLYAIDFYVSSVAECFYQNKIKKPFVPELTKEFLKNE